MSIIAELQRRNVFRMAGLYLVAAWLVVQVASTVLPAFEAPAWALRAVIVALVVGFLPALVFSWVFELTPEGLKRESEVDRSQSITRETGRTLDRSIMLLLALALAYFAFDKFVLDPRREMAAQKVVEARVAEARKQGGAEALVKSYGDKSIAVLPFVNMSNDADQEYFSDGISEELLNQLARIGGLRVIARTSSFAYKGKDVPIARIGEELSVAHVLEGSVRRSGERIRVTAQLIRTADSSHLWSQTFDRDLADIFAVQDEISAAVVAQLRVKLLGAPPKARVVDPQAHALYLQGWKRHVQFTPDGYAQAIALYQQALAIDDGHAEAWVALGQAHTALSNYGSPTPEEAYRLARGAVNRALRLDPGLAYAHGLMSRIASVHDRDLATASQHALRAVQLAPGDTRVLGFASDVAAQLGRTDLAIALGEAILARDPANPHQPFALCIQYARADRFDDALASIRRAQALTPMRRGLHYQIGRLLLAKGKPRDALLEIEKEQPGVFRLEGLAMVWHALGNREQSDTALAELVRDHAQTAAVNIAAVHAYRNEVDLAFEWLERGLASKDGGLSWIVSPRPWQNLHDDPRWLPFLRKIGRAPEQLAAIEFDVVPPSTGNATP